MEINIYDIIQPFGSQWCAPTSQNTLGCIEALLENGGNGFARAVVRLWLDLAWESVNEMRTGLSETGTEPKDIIAAFAVTVCELAEANIAHTGTVSGAHLNAMRQVMHEMGLEAL